MKTLIAVATAISALAAPALARASDLSGSWSLAVDFGGMAVSMTCHLEQSGDSLSGDCARVGGDPAEKPVAFTGGHVDGTKATWGYDITYQDMPFHLDYAANLKSDTSMDGTIEVSGQSGTFTATKSK